ncbi:MAG: DNA polymerase I [Christensenellaceae bacterium]|nr:DNA polymerase I [Christensenellaceae bacterium]
MRDTFLIVDGNSLMHRAFHALPLMDSEGTYTNAIYGFLNMLLKVIKEEDVRYIAVCFDEHGPTFRHNAYAEYKAGRSATPPELRQQFETIRSLLTDMGVRWYAVEGWEADDLLGTISRLGVDAGVAPLLLTGDRDALQLVGSGTELMFTRKGISETTRFTPATVHEEYGFSPEQVTDWKGLAGDSSDNIPGIPGVGDKTAVKLLQQYGTLENVLDHAGEVKGKLGEKLAAWADQARMCKDLATIRRDAPIQWKLSDCSMPDFRQAVPALKKLRLNAIIRRISENPENQAAAETDAPALLAFEEPASIADSGALTAWLAAVPENARPLALYMTDDAMSLAGQDGRCCAAVLGGDLLNPGLDPVEALSAVAPDVAAHETVVHDGKRLLHTLRKYALPQPERFAWDAMLGAYLINPQEKSYSFAALRGELPEDARGLLSLASWQQKRIEADQMGHLMRDVEMPLSLVLYRMEEAGFTVDTAFLKQLGERYVAEIEDCKAQVYKACGGKPFNLNSPQQLGAVLFEELKLPHGRKTQRGYSTDAETLDKLRDIAPEVIEPLLRYRQLTKLNSTYVEGLMRLTEPSGRVHSYFDQVATATGRISSSEPNLQNIPVRTAEGREIRRAFLPREGWVLLDADYSQIELRLMAHFSGDAALVEAFQTGQDVHARTASEIFDVPLEWVDGTLRSRAKAVNFGLIYGISGFGLARNTGVSQQEAKEFISRYFAKYPGVKRFMDGAAADGQQRGYALTMMGRRRYLPELKSSQATVREFGKRAAMNTPVQGTAADIIKLAMVRVDEALRREGLQSRLILQVHDELLLECPPEEVETAARLLRESMENVISLSVPLQADVHQGANWAEAK